MTTIYPTLKALLADAITSDVHEEDATEFLDDRRIRYGSHSREYLLSLAWRHGWRPPGDGHH
jgi:hypothetical protein